MADGVCKEWSRECSDTEKQTQDANKRQDRKCEALTESDCTDDKPVFENGKCRQRGPQDCKNEHWFDNGVCKPWSASECKDTQVLIQTPSNTQNIVCRDRLPKDCKDNQWLNNKICTDHSPACSDTQVEIQAASNTQDRKCNDEKGTKSIQGQKQYEGSGGDPELNKAGFCVGSIHAKMSGGPPGIPTGANGSIKSRATSMADFSSNTAKKAAGAGRQVVPTARPVQPRVVAKTSTTKARAPLSPTHCKRGRIRRLKLTVASP